MKFLPALLVIAATGCTHTQLGFNTTRQAHTVADVQTQQVLDNLARFVHNPNALPYFSYPNASGSGVNDRVNGAIGFDFNPYSSNFGFGGERSLDESYTLTPVNDAKKLELIRCAFQRAVSSCYPCNAESAGCPDCEKRFNEYYLGTPNPGKVGRVTIDGYEVYAVPDPSNPGALLEVYVATDDLKRAHYYYLDNGQPVDPVLIDIAKENKQFKRLYVDNSLAEATAKSGRVTPACLYSSCWFHVGEKCDVPHGDCVLVGHYCDTYVWVPECGRDQLTKLTLTVLDIALNEPATLPEEAKKEVVVYLDNKYKLSNEDNASYKITGTIKASELADSIIQPETAARKALAEQKVARAEAELKSALQQIPANSQVQKQLAPNGMDQITDEQLRDMARKILSADMLKAPAIQNQPAEVKAMAQRLVTAAQNLLDADEELETAKSEARVVPVPAPTFLAPEGLPERARTPIPGAGYLQFEQNLRTLTPGQ